MSEKAAGRKKSEGGSHRCRQCGRSFVNNFNLKRHVKRGGCLLVCQFCQKVLKTKNGLKNHIKSAHLNTFERTFACEICFKDFDSYASLQAHLSEDHIEKLAYDVVTNQYHGRHMVFRKFFAGKNAEDMDLFLEDEQQKEMFDVLWTSVLKHPHIKWSMNTHCLLSQLDEEGNFQGKRDYHIPIPIRQCAQDEKTVRQQIRHASRQLMDRLEDLETEGSGFTFVSYLKNDINVYSLN